MSSLWQLPQCAEIGGEKYAVCADFRDVLEVMRWLQDESEPEFVRWAVALGLFYEEWESIPEERRGEAAEWMAWFIAGGQKEDGAHGAKLFDWEQDAAAIVADVNRVAGCEVRAMPFLHWWSFLAFFGGIGDGQLAQLVGIRDKLRRGKKLEKWEQQFYRENKARVDLKPRYTREELDEQERLKKLLGE